MAAVIGTFKEVDFDNLDRSREVDRLILQMSEAYDNKSFQAMQEFRKKFSDHLPEDDIKGYINNERASFFNLKDAQHQLSQKHLFSYTTAQSFATFTGIAVVWDDDTSSIIIPSLEIHSPCLREKEMTYKGKSVEDIKVFTEMARDLWDLTKTRMLTCTNAVDANTHITVMENTLKSMDAYLNRRSTSTVPAIAANVPALTALLREIESDYYTHVKPHLQTQE